VDLVLVGVVEGGVWFRGEMGVSFGFVVPWAHFALKEAEAFGDTVAFCEIFLELLLPYHVNTILIYRS
jgi:hypothetical protein